MGGRETNDAIASAQDAFACEFVHAMFLFPLILVLLLELKISRSSLEEL